MSILLAIGGYLVDCALCIAAWRSTKVRKILVGRKETNKLIESSLSKDKPTIWVHASSLGEFEQGRPLIEEVRSIYPQYQILLSFYSPSGYEVRKTYSGVDCVVYLPGDTPKAVRAFLDVAQPSLAIFVKYDFWPVMLTALAERSIPTYAISAIFRPSQVFFKCYGIPYREVLKSFTHIFVQDDASVKLLQSYGIDRVSIAGDTRFDRAESIALAGVSIPEVEELRSLGSGLIVAGSTWHEDEELLVEYLNDNHHIKAVFAPHELHEEQICWVEESLKGGVVRLSQLRAGLSEIGNVQVLIIDCFGLLSSLYRYADIAYIGGGFGKGIHNTVEAAVYGVPLLFGPKYHKFREARLLIQARAAYSITNAGDLDRRLRAFFTDSKLREEAAMASRAVVEEQLGVTNKIIKQLNLE